MPDVDTTSPVRYFRNATGEVVHRAGCYRIGATAVPWYYAEPLTDAEVANKVSTTPWLRFCRHCEGAR